MPVTYPKIELHVHLEGTVRPETLLAIARRNDVSLPARSSGELRELYHYRDFPHFLEVWYLTTQALRTAEDFRQVVVSTRPKRGVRRRLHRGELLSGRARHGEACGEEIFSGYCEVPRRRASGLVWRYA